MSREGGGWLSYSQKPKTAAQRATREPERCHDAGPRSCCATCPDVCVGCFPSVVSESRNIILYSPSVLMEQIPYARCLQCQKNNQLWFHIAPNLSCFLRSLPMRRLLISLSVVCEHPRLVTRNDVGDKVGVFSARSLSSVQTEMRYSFWTLLSSFGTNFAAMPLMLSSSDKISWHVPYDSLIMLQVSLIVRHRSSRMASRTFVKFSVVVPVEGRPEPSSSSTVIRPFLKLLNHS